MIIYISNLPKILVYWKHLPNKICFWTFSDKNLLNPFRGFYVDSRSWKGGEALILPSLNISQKHCFTVYTHTHTLSLSLSHSLANTQKRVWGFDPALFTNSTETLLHSVHTHTLSLSITFRHTEKSLWLWPCLIYWFHRNIASQCYLSRCSTIQICDKFWDTQYTLTHSLSFSVCLYTNAHTLGVFLHLYLKGRGRGVNFIFKNIRRSNFHYFNYVYHL